VKPVSVSYEKTPVLISPAMDPCVAMGLVQMAVEIALGVLKSTTDPRVAAVARGTLVDALSEIPLILNRHQPLWAAREDN
jgi:hypothetical protein